MRFSLFLWVEQSTLYFNKNLHYPSNNSTLFSFIELIHNMQVFIKGAVAPIFYYNLITRMKNLLILGRLEKSSLYLRLIFQF